MLQECEYDRLAAEKLSAAAATTDPVERRECLNEAAVYATLAEKARRGEPIAAKGDQSQP